MSARAHESRISRGKKFDWHFPLVSILSCERYKQTTLPAAPRSHLPVRASLGSPLACCRSPAARFQLFGDDLPPHLPPVPDSFDFVFDVENKLRDSFPKTVHFWGEWTSAFLSLYRQLACLLAYATRPTLPSVVRHCWRRLDQASKIYDNCIQRLTQDSRLASLRTQTRPAGAIMNLVQDELEILQLEWICFLKASQCRNEDELLVAARQRIFGTLSLECTRLSLLYVRIHCPSSGAPHLASDRACLSSVPFHIRFACNRLVSISSRSSICSRARSS